MRRSLAVVPALLAVAAIQLPGHAVHAAPLITCTGARLNVRTLTDSSVSAVATSGAVMTSVAELVQIEAPSAQVSPPRHSSGTSSPNIVPVPLPDDARVGPNELTTYQVTANQMQAQLADDGTILLQIADPGTGDTMLAEFPDVAGCAVAGDPSLLAQLEAARGAFIAAEGMPASGSWTRLSDQAQLTGIGFFGASGAAGGGANAFELAPVLSYVATGNTNALSQPAASAAPGTDGVMTSTSPITIDGTGVLLQPTTPAPTTDEVTIPATALGPDGQSLISGPFVPGAAADQGSATDAGSTMGP